MSILLYTIPHIQRYPLPISSRLRPYRARLTIAQAYSECAEQQEQEQSSLLPPSQAQAPHPVLGARSEGPCWQARLSEQREWPPSGRAIGFPRARSKALGCPMYIKVNQVIRTDLAFTRRHWKVESLWVRRSQHRGSGTKAASTTTDTCINELGASICISKTIDTYVQCPTSW